MLPAIVRSGLVRTAVNGTLVVWLARSSSHADGGSATARVMGAARSPVPPPDWQAAKRRGSAIRS